MNRIVALDIGGVCISIHPERVVQGFGLIRTFFHAKETLDLCNRLETGKITTAEWLALLQKMTDNKFTPVELLTIWNRMLGDSFPGMADAVRRAVGRGWRFIYFSNTSEAHMDHFLKTNDFCHLVTGAVFSYESGSMKPDAKIYADFEAQYGKPAFYFDDRQENIDAGLKRGWNAVRFHSPDQLDELLR